tara:strand:- start:2795 stop:4294 length:1500 start_codon:yes stop_codon:yes gene_type:complete
MSDVVAQEASRPGMKVVGVRSKDLLSLLAGAALLFFMGWQWNTPLAAWLAPLFLIRFFRAQEKWTTTLIALPIIYFPLWFSVAGKWPMPLSLEFASAFTRLLPIVVALYIDRFAAQRLTGVGRYLVFPCALVVVDFLQAMGPVGSVFSPAATQFAITPLIQLSSITGIWGITFLTGWFATTGNALWESDFDLRATLKPVVIFSAVLGLVFFLGSIRTSQFRPVGETVRIGSVALDFDNPYWAEIKKANPREGKAKNAPGFARLIDTLYASSDGAVAQGAKIIFWSEANAPMYEDDEEAFLDRAKQFAKDNDVYLLPGMLVLHYDQKYAQNKVVLISPQGEILFSYEKTKTPKKSNSDGVLHFADTPYGRISASICFDMDFPKFANQLGKQGVDIMLVPSWDMVGIKPYHSDVGAFRAVENGFSSVRQVVKGGSLAVDYQGNILSYQDFFTVKDATMISDVPIKGVRTFYGRFGDWLVYLCGLILLGFVLVALRRPSKPN